MQRRTFLASAPAALALPSVVRAQSATTLRFIPQVDLTFLDPHWTTAYVTRNYGYMVFDTLYGQDASFKASPQMVAGHVVENDDKLWKLTLRGGLRWHDGENVLARDCVASIRRWAKRDAFGQALMEATDVLTAPDDKTIQFRLKRPFPLLPDALGKSPSPMPAMMPERLANTDPFKQITEPVGSGPFRYLANERVQGARDVFQRFEKYQPREGGTSDWTAGPKIVHFERVEWTTINEGATASAALQNDEQDWWEYAAHDLLPLLRKDRNIRVEVTDPTGQDQLLRPNHLLPPFNNPKLRQALFWGFDQADFMHAIVGNDPSMYRTPLGWFALETPMASDAGLEPLKGPRDMAKVREMVKQSGYAGEKVVLIVPSDLVALKAQGDVAADAMGQMGLNVDYVLTDWGTMLQRRNKKDPVDQGGWNCFVSGWAGTDQLNPAVHVALRGNGDELSSWPGWCVSPCLEELRNAWFQAPNLAAQQAVCADMQRQAMIDAPYAPLGQYIQPTAYRAGLTGVLHGFATFWSVRRT